MTRNHMNESEKNVFDECYLKKKLIYDALHVIFCLKMKI